MEEEFEDDENKGKSYSIDLDKLLPPDKYHLIAENIEECQQFADDMAKNLKEAEGKDMRTVHLEHELDLIEARIHRELESMRGGVNEVRDLLGNQNDEKKDQEPSSIWEDEHYMELYDELEKVYTQEVLDQFKNEKEEGFFIFRRHICWKTHLVSIKAQRAVTVRYLEEHVVPGNIGEGVVTFEGQTYIAGKPD
ncbi:hypothetical protein FUAX_24970 [Fulvitalea axinellae]|uniref:Uncharacterized protein n=1 Tax=Fulvitalea axinellae TaxID=1182444 RepID=A0AAU9DCC5_9BACT|nr:hypothetical protein FUAX_24970 [Fulvitalea axinellae]